MADSLDRVPSFVNWAAASRKRRTGASQPRRTADLPYKSPAAIGFFEVAGEGFEPVRIAVDENGTQIHRSDRWVSAELYDPLQMAPRGREVWVNDDAAEGEKGRGCLGSADVVGKVTVFLWPENIVPGAGMMNMVPQKFLPYGGQLFLLAQPAPPARRAWGNHVIRRQSSSTRRLQPFCTLPPGGTSG